MTPQPTVDKQPPWGRTGQDFNFFPPLDISLDSPSLRHIFFYWTLFLHSSIFFSLTPFCLFSCPREILFTYWSKDPEYIMFRFSRGACSLLSFTSDNNRFLTGQSRSDTVVFLLSSGTPPTEGKELQKKRKSHNSTKMSTEKKTLTRAKLQPIFGRWRAGEGGHWWKGQRKLRPQQGRRWMPQKEGRFPSTEPRRGSGLKWHQVRRGKEPASYEETT